jgi:hypothetical protein
MNRTNLILFGIGSILSIIIIVAVFLPWLTVYQSSGTENTILSTTSGWNIAQHDNYLRGVNVTQQRSFMPAVAFAGGLISLIACLIGISLPRRLLGIPIIIGGIMGVLGGLWAMIDLVALDIAAGAGPSAYMGVSDGMLSCFSAGIALLAIGIIRLVRSEAPKANLISS